MKHLAALILALATCDLAAAQTVPLPRPRPGGSAQAMPPDLAEPRLTACRLRLTSDRAVAVSLPPVPGPGECGADDVVQLEAVVLEDKRRVAITPPAVLRCTFAEAVVGWVREDVAPAAHVLNATVQSIDNYASYDCRGRNRVFGAPISEHGKANALDVRSIKLGNGSIVHLTDPQVSREFREDLRKKTCARFKTVLGPGSDGYHENHVHVDLAERRSGHRMCQWELREPVEEPASAAGQVPLPRPRPGRVQG